MALGPLPAKSPGTALEAEELSVSPLLEIDSTEMLPGTVPLCPSTPEFPWLVTNRNDPFGSTASPTREPCALEAGGETTTGLPIAFSVPSVFTENARTSLQKGVPVMV